MTEVNRPRPRVHAVTAEPLLIVLAGRPGTGKTTLGRRLAGALHCAYLRIDAIETAIVRCGLADPPVGPVGYVVAHEVAAATLALGTSVVVDAVNPVPEARAGWRSLAQVARLAFLETVVPDEHEHRRRVDTRRPDLADQVVPTWDDVMAADYVPWDDKRDGQRHLIDMTDPDRAVAAALELLRPSPDPA
jgi:predicted kinase